MSDHATLRDAILYFAEFENCRQFMIKLRWADGVVKCPVCGATKLTWLEKQRVWKCYETHPKPRFSLKTGTIFEDSPIALEKWLPAVWMLLNCKNGISSWELHRGLGVTQKTAWFMLQRIRLAMQSETYNKLGGPGGGPVEVDETFIGGKARNMHKNSARREDVATGGSGKEIVLGMVERGGTMRAVHVSKRSKPVLQRHVREHVAAESALFTDALKSYEGMPEFKHEMVDHAVEYVRGNVHTNTAENFWALLKRCLKGTYVSVEPFHLFRYLDEQTFRYNNRDMDDIHRFVFGMRHIVGRRLTYKQLTGKEGNVSHG
jgi:transposase-like protein